MLAAAAAALLIAAAPAPDPAFTEPFVHAQVMSTERIIGGSVAASGSYPMALQLGAVDPAKGNAPEQFFCGASLIAPRWVLTAAHCVVEPNGEVAAPETLTLRGSLRRGEGGQTFRAARVVAHEGYKPDKGGNLPQNDVALIELRDPAPLPTATLLSAAFAPKVLVPERGTLTVVGWGNTTFVPSGSSNQLAASLLHVELDLIDTKVCEKVYAHFSGDFPMDGSQICAGVLDRCTADGHCADACQGDSGGPLFVRRPDGLIQAGVVSYGFECGRRGVPGVYASVSFQEGWIKRHVPEAHFAAAAPVGFAPLDGVISTVAADPARGPAVTLSLAGGERQRAGSELRLTLVSNVPGRLLLFNQDEQGIGRLKFPNPFSRRAGAGRELVTAGRTIDLPDPNRDPYAFEVALPAGRNRLVAVVVPAGAPVEPVVAGFLQGGEIRDMAGWLRDLASHLPAGQMALGSAEYDIVP